MGTPLVSVIIPTYRRGELLRAAVQSVLAQTLKDIEVLVVEDGSDVAEQVLRGLDTRVRYLWQENRGVSVARNTGAAHANADWLAFLDDDDLWQPEKLERQLALADRHKSFDMIHTDYSVLIDGHLRPGPRLIPRDKVPSGAVGRDLFLNNFVITSSVMMRRTVFEGAVGFDPRFKIAQDFDLWLRVAQTHQVGFLNEPLVIYRDHESLSSPTERVALERIAVLTSFLESHPHAWQNFGSATVRARLAEAYWQAAYAHYVQDDYRAARGLFFWTWRWKPTWVKPALYGSACLTGATGMRLMRVLRQAVSQ